MLELTIIRHLIIDMDGVLYLGDKPMPRLGEFFNFLARAFHSIYPGDEQLDPHSPGIC